MNSRFCLGSSRYWLHKFDQNTTKTASFVRLTLRAGAVKFYQPRCFRPPDRHHHHQININGEKGNFQFQFKISVLIFFQFFLLGNTCQYVVVLGRRKNQTLFWASFGKVVFFGQDGFRNPSWPKKPTFWKLAQNNLWFFLLPSTTRCWCVLPCNEKSKKSKDKNLNWNWNTWNST